MNIRWSALLGAAIFALAACSGGGSGSGGGSSAAPSSDATQAPPTPTPAATASPTASPTTAPTTSPSYSCDNASFLSKQSAYLGTGSGADVEENVCGTVTSVLAEKHTSSGNHGYFYVQVASGDTIEIVSNLDAMGEASSNKPPATWPWVAVGQYAYVKGRYYFDNASSQGIDWTEDDIGSWPNTGYVVICDTATTNCNYYW